MFHQNQMSNFLNETLGWVGRHSIPIYIHFMHFVQRTRENIL